jgi:hypothetical protein
VIAVDPIAPTTGERANSCGLGTDGRKSIEARGPCIKMSTRVSVEQSERAIDRPWITADALEVNLQAARDFCGVDGALQVAQSCGLRGFCPRRLGLRGFGKCGLAQRGSRSCNIFLCRLDLGLCRLCLGCFALRLQRFRARLSPRGFGFRCLGLGSLGLAASALATATSN